MISCYFNKNFHIGICSVIEKFSILNPKTSQKSTYFTLKTEKLCKFLYFLGLECKNVTIKNPYNLCREKIF